MMQSKRFQASNALGFTLIEILVFLVIFAAMAAITWGALSQIASAQRVADGTGSVRRRGTDSERS